MKCCGLFLIGQQLVKESFPLEKRRVPAHGIAHDIHVQLTGCGDGNIDQTGSLEKLAEPIHREKIDVMRKGNLARFFPEDLQIKSINSQSAHKYGSARTGEGGQIPDEMEGVIDMFENLKTGDQIRGVIVARDILNNIFHDIKAFGAALLREGSRRLDGHGPSSGEPLPPLVEKNPIPRTHIDETFHVQASLTAKPGQTVHPRTEDFLAPDFRNRWKKNFRPVF